MKEQFLTYEQALALKELGFDEPCLATHGYLDLYIGTDDGHVKAPLKSQFFKWVREKYGYNTEIIWMTAIVFKYTAVIKSKVGTDYMEEYDTYEQAEYDCINKIIELLKLK